MLHLSSSHFLVCSSRPLNRVYPVSPDILADDVYQQPRGLKTFSSFGSVQLQRMHPARPTFSPRPDAGDAPQQRIPSAYNHLQSLVGMLHNLYGLALGNMRLQNGVRPMSCISVHGDGARYAAVNVSRVSLGPLLGHLAPL